MSQIAAVAMRMNLQLPHPATIFGITVHGVQPLFLIRDQLHVLDRNLLSKIRARKPSSADGYWISQLNSPAVTVNPIFTATEGIERRAPTQEEFVKSYFDAEATVREHLPLVGFIPHTEKTVSGSYALIEDLKDRRSRETEFLVRVAPLVATRSSDNHLLQKEQAILSYAATYGLTGGSLSLLAVLSCLYESVTGTPTSPGRGVLKPKATYTAENAHNCLSDLLALELVVAASSLGLGDHAFVTGDKHLGRFWQALGATATSPVNGRGTGRFKITRNLLQRINDGGLLRLQAAFSGQKV